MQSLRPRVWALNVEGLEVSALDFEFTIKRSLKPEQNTAEIRIYNLQADLRRALASVQQGVRVELRGGYAGGLGPTLGEPYDQSRDTIPRLFLGTIRIVTVAREEADWVVVITSGDGDKKKRPVNFSLGKNASIEATVKKLAGTMQVGIGNTLQAIKDKGLVDGLGSVFSSSVVVAGQADKEMAKLLAAQGLEYSVQDEELQVLEIGKPLTTQAILLTPETSLVGSPEVGRDDKGAMITARAFLSGDLTPGKQVQIRSSTVNATFRVESVSHTGQTYGNDWYTDIEARTWK